MESEISYGIMNNIMIGKEEPIDNSCTNTGELILKAFESRPDFVGQVDAMTGEENTFQQMRERSVKCALWMKKIGVQCDDIIVMYTSNHLDTYIPYLATLYIGAVLHMWNINKPIYVYYLQAHPKIIFTDDDKAPLILKITERMNISTTIVVLKENKESKHEVKEEFQYMKFILNSNFNKTEIDKFSCKKLKSNKDTAVILLSSSTTDLIQQHVVIPHVFFTSPSNQQIPFILSNDVGLWAESLYWNISLLLTVRAILSYVKAVKINILLKPVQMVIPHSDVQYLCSTIQKYKVNWVFLKNGMSRGFRNCCFEIFQNYDFSSLRQIIIGGRQLSDIVHFTFCRSMPPNVSIIKAYCLPETGVITYQAKNGNFQSSGYASRNVSLLIADFFTGLVLEPNYVGVIWCKSSALTSGYLNSMRGTVKALTCDNGWFCTDDMGFYNIHGVCILERRRNVITYQDKFILPITIESLLRTHPMVIDACVVPIRNEFDGHHPFAAVKTIDDCSKEEKLIIKEELKECVARFLPDFMQLRGGLMLTLNIVYLQNGYPNRKNVLLQKKKRDQSLSISTEQDFINL